MNHTTTGIRQSGWNALARFWLIAAAIFVMCSMSGCNIVGPAMIVAAGPPKVEARYTLADVPTVVFVDDRSNLVSPTSLRRTIADRASQELLSNNLVSMSINPQDGLLIAARTDRAGALMNIVEIGRAVGAHQVVYVQMAQFSDTPDGYTPIPTASAYVKVIDVTNDQRMFPGPDMADGFPVTASTKPVDPSMFASRATRLQIYEALAAKLGDEVAKLFYKHEYKEIGENLR